MTESENIQMTENEKEFMNEINRFLAWPDNVNVLAIFRKYSEQSHKQVVMQAEGSDDINTYKIERPVEGGLDGKEYGFTESEGAAVASEGQGEANMSADAGCPRCKSSDLLDTDDHWTHCQNCGFSFVG